MTNKKFDIVGGTVAIVPAKKKTFTQDEQNQTAVVPMGTGSTLQDLYDRLTRLIYLIDASGSMGEGMKTEDKVNSFEWTPEILKEFREAIKNEDASEDDGGDEDSMEDVIEESLENLSDEELKEFIIGHNLISHFGINVPRKKPVVSRGYQQGRSKMMAVKEAAKDFVTARFKKFADAKVMLYTFEMSPHLRSSGASEEDVISSIDNLPDFGGGGTDIYAAVSRAVNDCQKRASEVGLHHIVLVSDGLDEGAIRVKNLVPQMKEVGIVFDFIFIKGGTEEDSLSRAIINALAGVCEATGGKFETVETEKDFQQKFFAASNRKCLPPARGI